MKKIMQREKKTIVLYVKKNPSAIFKIAKVKITKKKHKIQIKYFQIDVMFKVQKYCKKKP